MIEQPIKDGQGVIRGGFTAESANSLAVQLRYGSLPIPLNIEQIRVIGPTLGQDSLEKSLVAGLIGFSIVMLFMAIYYRVPGFVADLALIFLCPVDLCDFQNHPCDSHPAGYCGFSAQHRCSIGREHSHLRAIERRITQWPNRSSSH